MGKDKALGENGAYWAQRMRFYEQACARKNAKITAEIDAAFSKANSDIERDLEYWYGRLAKNNGISLAAARRLLDAGELAEFKWSVDEYMAKAMQSGNGRWLKELENASARVHISRLDAMKISMRNTLESAFGRENSIVTKMAGETYRDAVRHTAAEMEKLFKAEFNIGEIDDEKIRKLIRKPWTPDARTFSDRIWAKKNEMINALQEELTRGCIYGRSLDETIARMEKFVDAKFKNAKYAARRIVVTESAFFRVLGTRDELAAIGVEEFQVDLPIDAKTCEICREMNGRIFPMSEFAVGLNAPPFHPNCENGSIIPVMDEDFEAALKEVRESGDQGESKFNSPTDENAQYSKSPRINPDNEAKFTRTPNGMKPFEITACHADGTNNNIFISGNAKEFMKPRDIHELDRRFTEVFKLLNAQNSEVLPKICVASVDEIVSNAAAAYNAIDNVIFINERIFQLPTGDFACPDNKLSTILHECIHWKDAAEYRMKFGEITKQNCRTEYLPYIKEKSKKALDKLEEKGYNIYEISKYATAKYVDDMFDEVYTEYRVLMLLGGD